MNNGQIERWIKRLQKHQEFLSGLKFENLWEHSLNESKINDISKEIGLLHKLLRLREEAV
tara:strand:+ start:74 stop:253 length:180 start_codon:yes stop_codon:yes gene_type:complete